MTERLRQAADETEAAQGLLRAFQRFQGHNADLTATFVSRFGVGANELRGLLVVNANGPMPLKALSALMRLIPSTTTFLVDRLVRAGYVTRSPHPDDRRSQLVTVTGEGAAVVAHLWDAYEAIFSDGLDAAQMRRFTCGLESLSAVMQKVEVA